MRAQTFTNKCANKYECVCVRVRTHVFCVGVHVALYVRLFQGAPHPKQMRADWEVWQSQTSQTNVLDSVCGRQKETQ